MANVRYRNVRYKIDSKGSVTDYQIETPLTEVKATENHKNILTLMADKMRLENILAALSKLSGVRFYLHANSSDSAYPLEILSDPIKPDEDRNCLYMLESLIGLKAIKEEFVRKIPCGGVWTGFCQFAIDSLDPSIILSCCDVAEANLSNYQIQIDKSNSLIKLLQYAFPDNILVQNLFCLIPNPASPTDASTSRRYPHIRTRYLQITDDAQDPVRAAYNALRWVSENSELFTVDAKEIKSTKLSELTLPANYQPFVTAKSSGVRQLQFIIDINPELSLSKWYEFIPLQLDEGTPSDKKAIEKEMKEAPSVLFPYFPRPNAVYQLRDKDNLAKLKNEVDILIAKLKAIQAGNIQLERKVAKEVRKGINFGGQGRDLANQLVKRIAGNIANLSDVIKFALQILSEIANQQHITLKQYEALYGLLHIFNLQLFDTIGLKLNPNNSELTAFKGTESIETIFSLFDLTKPLTLDKFVGTAGASVVDFSALKLKAASSPETSQTYESKNAPI